MLTRFRRRSLILLILTILAVTVGAVAQAVKPSVATAGPPQATAAGGLTKAPLNAEFVRYQAEFPLGTPQWIATGMGFGEQPAPLDLSYARGLSIRKTRDRAYLSSYDLRTLGKVTSVKNQNPYGTCWAFASTGSMESCLMPGENLDFSEDNMVLTSGFDTGGDPYNAGGSLPRSTAYLVRWSGPVYESEDAYGDSVTPPGLTARKHVQDVSWIPARSSSTDNDNVKYLVSTYGGVDVSISWQGATDASSSYYNATTDAYYYDGSVLPNTNHEVLIVGWDDNYAAANFATTPPGNGAFIVKNSWGTGWGVAGYFYVSYYDTMFGTSTALGVFNGAQPTTNYSDVYQYDPLGWVGNYTTNGSQTGWMANVYTARATASLSAVGFYAGVPNTSYQVWAGSSLATLSPRTSGTLATMGYHTVSLPATVAVTGGRPFVVAAQLTTPGWNYPIPGEWPVSGYSSGATAQAGQSYLSSNGTTWTDLTTLYANENVCLKAYTTPYTSTAPVPDIAPPTTAVAGVPAGWSKTPVTATFGAVDTESGVAYTECSLDGGAFVRGARVTVASAGAHTLAYRSADNAGNLEAAKTVTVSVDPTGPTTIAYAKVTVKKGKIAKFRFKIVDLTQTANVKFRIYKGTRLKKILLFGDVKTGSVMIGTWRCKLAKGRYTWRVYATDQAGNEQRNVGWRALVVK